MPEHSAAISMGRRYSQLKRTLCSVAIVLAGLLSPSCMHLAMPAMHGDVEETSALEPSTEKVVIAAGIRASATFPPLELGKDTPIELRLMDSKTFAPISGAQVYFHAEYIATTSPEKGDLSESNPAGLDSTHGHHGNTEFDMSIESLLAESHDRGIYATSFVARHPGEYTLMFHVASIRDRTLSPELVIEAKRTAFDGKHDHSGIMTGMQSSSTLFIIGGILMGGMMIAMLLGRGWRL